MRRISVCFLLAGLSQAVQVYLNPSPSLPPNLSPSHASFILSRHLGLEFFESARNEVYEPFLNEQAFVGQGSRSALLLSIDEQNARDVIPSSIKPSFSLSNIPSLSSLSSLISTYLHRAPHMYTSVYSEFGHPTLVPRFLDIFSVSSPAAETFIAEMSALSEFLDSDESSTDKFAAFELKGLSSLAEAYGRSSEQYQLAARTTRALLESAISKPNINLALLTFSPSKLDKRQAQPPQQSPLPPQSPVPQQPISGVSTCFASADACADSTNSCSGRGQCLQASKAGRTCFVCACSKTSDKGKTQTWVGDACERKDISGPFVLLAGSTIALILLIAGSISLLAGISSEKLPSTLTGGAVNGKRE